MSLESFGESEPHVLVQATLSGAVIPSYSETAQQVQNEISFNSTWLDFITTHTHTYSAVWCSVVCGVGFRKISYIVLSVHGRRMVRCMFPGVAWVVCYEQLAVAQS